jgi:membrane protein YqaA with SNARE-associated domain
MSDWWVELHPFATPARAYTVSLVVSLISGLVPVVNIEAYLVSVALLAPTLPGWPVVLIATLGQMVSKYILYVSGRDGLRPRVGRHGERLERAGRLLTEHPAGTSSVVAASAFLGLPPFYAVSVMAGVLRLPLLRFMTVASVCRVARFALVYYAPAWFKGLAA